MKKTNKELSIELKNFIKNVHWTFAKTMADWPHEYIVFDKVDKHLFNKLGNHIDKFGHDEYYYERKKKYFEYNGHTYWRSGDIIINRCLNKDTYSQRRKDNRLPKK